MTRKEFIDNEVRVVVQDIENISKIVAVQSNEFNGDHQSEMTLLWNMSMLNKKIDELKELIELKSTNK
jgi:predicted secreted protein